MALWIPITIFAAFMQNIRSSIQKHLKGRLSTSGATFARFVYAAPLAGLYLGGLMAFADYDLPTRWGPDFTTFAVYAAIGGIGQIMATGLLVYIFAFRNFAVGTAFTKTETVQTALFGIVVLGETVSDGALAGIVVSLVGVLMLAITRASLDLGSMLRQCLERPALLGIASGGCFAISAVGYRAAALSLESGDFIIRAAFTLFCVTTFQTVVMAVYMRLREPGQISAVFRAWKIAGLAGLTGMLASAGWFTAITLQNAAYVRALGQIELIFTFAASYLIFREQAKAKEIVGIALVALGIVILALAH